METGADTELNAGSADPQYRDVETGEQLNGAGVTVTLEVGEERVVRVVTDESTAASISASSTITTTANVHVRHTVG